MSRDFTDIDGDRLTRFGAVVTAAPLSLFCWFMEDDATTEDYLISLGVTTNDFNRFTLKTISGTGTISANIADATTALGTVTTSAHSTGVWENGLAVFDTSARAVYLNGGSKGSSGATLTPSGVNSTRVSGRLDANSNFFDGRIAHVAIWNAALSDAEAVMLGAQRVSPLVVRRGSLVAYYPFIGRDSPEIDVIGGNSLTVTGTAVSASDPPALWLPGKQKIFIPAAGAAPAFDAGPTINSVTETAYTLGYTPTAAATFYAIAIVSGGTVPTAAQVIAGVDYAGGDVVAAVNEAVTGPDTTVLGGSLTRPVHDIYCVLNNGGGNSAVAAFTGALLAAAAGRQYATHNTSGGVTSESFMSGASPAGVTGDVMSLSTTVSPGGYALGVEANGIPRYDGNGDSSRQTFTVRFWDASLDAYSDASPVASYVNNQTPAFVGDGGEIILVFPLSVVIPATDLRQFWTDFEGDALVVTAVDAEPTGLSLGGSTLTGTPTVRAVNFVTHRATDVTGDQTDADLTIIIGRVDMPNLIGLDLVAATQRIEDSYLGVTSQAAPVFQYVPGLVTAQSPVAGSQADPFSSVELTVGSNVYSVVSRWRPIRLGFP